MGGRVYIDLSLSIISDVHLMPLGLSLLFVLQVVSKWVWPVTSKELPRIESQQYIANILPCSSHLLPAVDQCNTLCLCLDIATLHTDLPVTLQR